MGHDEGGRPVGRLGRGGPPDRDAAHRNALVVAGSRQRVQYPSDLLRKSCEGQHVQNEFFAHYGNLSKHLCEELEARLK